MKKQKLIKYVPEVCACCGQDKNYELGLDKGSAIIVKKIAQFIRRKGINCVHPRKEMEGEWLTSNQVGNLSRPRFHGLIASVKDEPGNYCLTSKGARFLRGEAVPKIAIVEKGKVGTGPHNIGYHLPDEITTTFQELMVGEPYWLGIDYTIEAGRIILDNQQSTAKDFQQNLF